ncbi:hypothetical protein SADUNF_Sadunf04G0085500 [Salix dunnii]|uniref:Uncharacterized protein n=1 Tax=Salix dunnii TaxID=1413687 RepID=A0A835MZ19_9ROSI|nr:hypothetical protein SADUNF_Sadunf04G0085500 [Salix dunnii]
MSLCRQVSNFGEIASLAPPPYFTLGTNYWLLSLSNSFLGEEQMASLFLVPVSAERNLLHVSRIYLGLQLVQPLIFSASNLLGATAHGMMVEQKQFSEMVTNKGWIRSTLYDCRVGGGGGGSGMLN